MRNTTNEGQLNKDAKVDVFPVVASLKLREKPIG